MFVGEEGDTDCEENTAIYRDGLQLAREGPVGENFIRQSSEVIWLMSRFGGKLFNKGFVSLIMCTKRR